MSDEYFDLIVWYDPPESIHGFQLCYDKQDRQRALTWTRTRGFLHTSIDDGEASCLANRTPILTPDGDFPAEIVAAEFHSRSETLTPEIRDLVLSKITAFEASQKS